EKAVPAEGFEPKKQWEAALESIRWLRENLDGAGREGQRLLVVADGDFSVAEFRAQLPPPERVVLLTRCAKNRALYELPRRAEPKKRRGRRRKYGDRAKKPFEWLQERAGWERSELLVRGRRVPRRVFV
ncbi:MAG: transposase, partial [Actinomycetota bacterium]|nr:transposase [Actinomycetota bacterium]